jgi:hypothetical protein
MKTIRLAGLTLTVTLAITLTAATTALANAHFRWGDIGSSFTGLSGTVAFRATAGTVPLFQCNKDTSSGSITSLDLIGNLSIHFLECAERNTKEESCEVESVGASRGLVLFTGLHALLGLILPRSGSGVGLLVLPGTGHVFTTIRGTECAEESALTGSFAGEVTPVARAATLTSVTFALTAGNQNIKDIDILGSNVKPGLTFLSIAYTVTTLETLHWLSQVEVT